MKQFFLFASLAFCVKVYATVRTVSNTPGTVAQFTTIQAAVNASTNGDTIYVHGSTVNYTGFSINDKRLVVIGPGRAPIQSFMAVPAMVMDMTISGSGSSNTEIHGLHFISTINMTSFNHPDNIRFIRNFFGSSISIGTGTNTYSGFLFESNWFDNTGFSVAQSCFFQNFIVRNNVFYCGNSNANVSGFYNSISVIFDHNLFYGPSTLNAPTNVFGTSCRNLLLTNNIFVRRNASANISSSVFNRNLTFNCFATNPWDTSGNTGNDNIVGDPQMADQNAVNSGSQNPLLNFTIAAGPANNSGTDNKDLGLLFDPVGSLNWTNSRMSRIPFVYSMNITNANIPAGGTLNVQVEARKNN